MAQLDADVLVVGAGPVGLVMAAELVRHGARVRIIDKAAAPFPYCRAIGITPRTLEVYEDMGIARPMIDAGLWLDGLRVEVKDAVSRVHRVELSDLPYAGLGLPQPETERILGAHLASLGVNVERGVAFTSLTMGREAVDVNLAGPDGTTRTGRFAYVVGCDGAHSAVRRALNVAFEGEAFPYPFTLGDVHAEWPPEADLPRGFALRAMELHDDAPPDMFIAIPLPERGRYRVSMLAEPLPEDAAGSADGVSHGIQAEQPGVSLAALQTVADRVMAKPPKLSDLRWSSRFRISMRLAANYRVGRAFLAGDAAHIHPPTGGQGMNTGIQDAYNLAWKLGLVLRHGAAPALLDSYEAERRPVARDVIARTTEESINLGRRRTPPNRLADTQILLSYRGTAGFLHADVNDIGGAPPAGAPVAGDRAPDVQGLTRHGLGFPLRLFDLTRGTAHVLIVMIAPDPGVLATLEADARVLSTVGLPLRVVAVTTQGALEHVPLLGHLATPQLPQPLGLTLVHDAAGGFAEAYRAAPGSAFLVRPDGYLGWTGRPFDRAALRAVLPRLEQPPEG
ncbi:oxygenase [Azorhizobium oxalatiphilum]|uniref:Oxygenase n=1 Tax=Azorhizobium oxalatiphilum TaxID=980631 RepID=A0A917FBS9_9HYPH|nr:FAD-dependent monooxygenase [Azorhizobium oxalatiphilum]GGF65955.1 oxygenase [Azorhizobium oxalatiphilum]